MTTSPHPLPDGVEIKGPAVPEAAEILTPDAVRFAASLVREFAGRRNELLAKRAERHRELDAGKKPDFLESTRKVREEAWKVAPIPGDLQDRRVEITGPADRKMIINALNCGANVFMADFEDSNAPTWRNMVSGQLNVRDAARGDITFANPDGKLYKLKERTATLMVRPRGWHLDEKHFRVDGKPAPAALFDFALSFFHNARRLVEKESGPYFYLPKLESHLEARLWNDVFCKAQDALGLPRGTVRATVLIETILAAFEMEEILYELRDHSAGLNCGRWDYIFSFIKKFRRDPACLLPDRAQVGMTSHFLRSYSLLLIKTCHKRGAHAMGGMAAQIPIKNDPAANEQALAKVRADKVREAGDGHDGTWVAHPDLVAVAKAEFDKAMPTAHQIHNRREDVAVTAADLLRVPDGAVTERGLRTNLNVGVLYLEAWLRGSGCVPLYNLMEDAATAEISRAQVWQWSRHGAKLSDGRAVTPALVRMFLDEEMARIRGLVGEDRFAGGKFALAEKLFHDMTTAKECPDFLTLAAYEHLD